MQRVDNFAAGFLRAGARAVVAEAYLGPAYYVTALLGGGGSIERIWTASPDRKRAPRDPPWPACAPRATPCASTRSVQTAATCGRWSRRASRPTSCARRGPPAGSAASSSARRPARRWPRPASGSVSRPLPPFRSPARRPASRSLSQRARPSRSRPAPRSRSAGTRSSSTRRPRRSRPSPRRRRRRRRPRPRPHRRSTPTRSPASNDPRPDDRARAIAGAHARADPHLVARSIARPGVRGTGRGPGRSRAGRLGREAGPCKPRRRRAGTRRHLSRGARPVPADRHAAHARWRRLRRCNAGPAPARARQGRRRDGRGLRCARHPVGDSRCLRHPAGPRPQRRRLRAGTRSSPLPFAGSTAIRRSSCARPRCRHTSWPPGYRPTACRSPTR